MLGEYIEAENPNAAEAFPYCVRETAYGITLSFDPAFHVMHWHDDVQFLYVAEGTIEVQTLEDLVTIRQGEGCFLGKDVVHCVRSTKTAHYYNFLYPADRLRLAPDSPANDDIALVTSGTALPLCPLTAATDWERRALALLQELVSFTKETPDAFPCHVLVRLLALVLLLRTHAPLEHGKAAEDSNTLRTKQILRYIAAHYAEAITLEDLAQSAHCSKSACLRAFRISLKTTPYKYLIEYRLEQAALLLRQTQTPIGEIAEAVGFHQFSLFGKSFKRMTGQTPKDYRKAQAMTI